jgi:hypothetical protein
LDIYGAYNLIHIAKGKEWKTAFCTHYGLFESLVMPFGLTNALVIFQNYNNDIVAPYLDYFYTAYLDNTLIYSDNFEEHQQHILSWPVILKVYHLLRYDGIPHKIMVHYRSESCGIIACHLTS